MTSANTHLNVGAKIDTVHSQKKDRKLAKLTKIKLTKLTNAKIAKPSHTQNKEHYGIWYCTMGSHTFKGTDIWLLNIFHRKPCIVHLVAQEAILVAQEAILTKGLTLE